MNKDSKKPYEFPQECPERDQKFNKAVIVDVVENEINPNKVNKHEFEMEIKKNMH